MQVKTQLDDIQNYLADASNMSGGHAERLVIPETADEIADVLREANDGGTAVTISGGRTGTVGGALPFGGVIVSMERLNKIIATDRDAMTMTVEPGVLLADIQRTAESEGLFYPPDPTEWSCQIGGNVATNASGARSFKYGSTRDYVNALTVVLADGDIVKLSRGEVFSNADGILTVTTGGREITANVPTYERQRVRKNASGYFNETPLDAIDLFIGSEGTLGVITEIELRLLPKPAGFFSGIVFFNEHSDLLSFVDAARSISLQRGARKQGRNTQDTIQTDDAPVEPLDPTIEPSDSALANARALASEARSLQKPAREQGRNTHDSLAISATLLEYFDDKALGFAREKFPETPENMAGAVFFEQETTPGDEDELLAAWNSLLETHNADLDASWFTTTEHDREKMRAFRHALPLAANERYARHKYRKVSTDMAVPDENFAGFLRFQKEMLESSGIEYVIFGHIGDCHLHVNLFPKTDDEATRARHIYGRFIAQSIMIGGCISAEHGIGKLKSKYLYVSMGERYLNEMADVKRAFDPKGILGRGNMFAADLIER